MWGGGRGDGRIEGKVGPLRIFCEFDLVGRWCEGWEFVIFKISVVGCGSGRYGRRWFGRSEKGWSKRCWISHNVGEDVIRGRSEGSDVFVDYLRYVVAVVVVVTEMRDRFWSSHFHSFDLHSDWDCTSMFGVTGYDFEVDILGEVDAIWRSKRKYKERKKNEKDMIVYESIRKAFSLPSLGHHFFFPPSPRFHTATIPFLLFILLWICLRSIRSYLCWSIHKCLTSIAKLMRKLTML